MIVTLESLNNSDCTVFPPGIDVNVTFASISAQDVVVPVYSTTLYDFDYSSTIQITLDGIPDLPTTILHVFIEISTYAEITRFEVL